MYYAERLASLYAPFTDLEQIVEGDTFTVNVLNEVLTYGVERVLIILPTETGKLAIFPNEDIVTLMTCTPYGVNTQTFDSCTQN